MTTSVHRDRTPCSPSPASRAPLPCRWRRLHAAMLPACLPVGLPASLTNGVVAGEAKVAEGDLSAGDEVVHTHGRGEVLQHGGKPVGRWQWCRQAGEVQAGEVR